MSKITVSAVLTVLRLVISLVTKSIRLVYGIIDLVDDGCINASVTRPDWVVVLEQALESFRNLDSNLRQVEGYVQE